MRTYRYYRDLIYFRESSDPISLMRLINPKESKLLDLSTDIKIRFRLSAPIEKVGSSALSSSALSPPQIMYKIYINKKIVDLNSFSPRNYIHVAQKLPKHIFNHSGSIGINVQKCDGFYSRVENNEWRTVDDSDLLAASENSSGHASLFSRKETKLYHHDRKKRRSVSVKRKKETEEKWNEAFDFLDDKYLSWSSKLDYSEYQKGWYETGTASERRINA